MNKTKLLQMAALLAVIVVLAGGFLRALQHDSMTLTDYESQQNTEGKNEESGDNPGKDSAAAADTEGKPDDGSDHSADTEESDGGKSSADALAAGSRPVGVLLNANMPEEERITYSEGFYYEPLSDNLRRYITGVSYPSLPTEKDNTPPAITPEELRYVHIWHYDFDGTPREGELICNEYIAQDLVEIFYELYRCEYQLEKVLLIDEYDGDDTASMADNNTSCFNYRQIAGSTSLSKHALGLAVDINPLYNPQITYEKDGTEVVSPAAALPYADRSSRFAYKIDENDLCCRLFVQHGFTWGGNWNSTKDYQHFQKAAP